MLVLLKLKRKHTNHHGICFVCLISSLICGSVSCVYFVSSYRNTFSVKSNKGAKKDDEKDNDENDNNGSSAVIPGLLTECPLCHRKISRWQGNKCGSNCSWCFGTIKAGGVQFVCKNTECEKKYQQPICYKCWYKQTTMDTYK